MSHARSQGSGSIAVINVVWNFSASLLARCDGLMEMSTDHGVPSLACVHIAGSSDSAYLDDGPGKQ